MKTLLEELHEQIPLDLKLLVEKQSDIAVQIAAYLKERNWSHRDLAKHSGFKESYVSRVLSGETNLTLKTICRLEATIGKPIITTPNQLVPESVTIAMKPEEMIPPK